MFRKSATLLSVVAAMVLAVAAPAQAATPSTPEPTSVQLASGPGWVLVGEAKPGTTPPTAVNDCGIVSCSLYFSRAETREANRRINLAGGGLAGLATICGWMMSSSGPAAHAVGLSCTVSVLTYGPFFLDAVSRAGTENRCLRIRYGPMQPYTFHSDNSRFCHNT
jgi:hypothetical protein